jgi:ABC-type cobalamin/Fe3+-siderophores transport system ATPase subunit
MNIEIEVKNYRCFPDTSPADFELGEGFTALVGANNSGKSSLLRLFYEFRSIFQYASSPPGLEPALKGTGQGWPTPPSVLDPEEVFSNINDRDVQILLRFKPSSIEVQSMPPNSIDRLCIGLSRKSKQWTAKVDGLYPESNRADLQLSATDINLYLHTRPLGNFKMILEGMKLLARCLYIGSFRNAIHVGSTEDYFDIKIGQAFSAEWRTHKTGSLKRRNEAIHRLTEDVRKIFGFDQLEINPSEDARTLKLLVNGKSYSLGELGSGISQFILVLANAAIREPSLILIDEPELNLHPSLQLDFLTTLSSYADVGIVFATHSIGLARACADPIYVLRRVNEGESKMGDLESTPRLSEFLGELSFSGYRELGFRKVLLVEGKTEVQTFQQILRRYGKDHQVVLLPLGGNTLISDSSVAELAEITRISDDISAVIDSELPSAGASMDPIRTRFVETCAKLKIKCHVLERRATENYLSDRAVKEVKGAKFRCLGAYEKLSDVAPSWSKSENWRIARRMTRDELDATDLGKFLAEI